MSLKSVSPEEFTLKPVDLWGNQWLLLTCGDYAANDYNTMTVAWGSIGVMWQKPFVQAVVRPTRHTFQFMEKYDTFTLCAFPEQHRKALQFLGSRSGRDGDKIAATDLNVIASKHVAAPSFAEAELIIECRKIYVDDFKPENFLDPSIESKYPKQDYHRIYFGEIVSVLGTDKYL